MNIWPLLVGMLCLFAVGKALVVGGASVTGEGFRREDEPVLFWSIVAAGIIFAGFLFYQAFPS